MLKKAMETYFFFGVRSFLSVNRLKSWIQKEEGNQTIEMVVFAFIIGIMVIFAATSMNTSLRTKFTGILQNINNAKSNTNL